MALQRRRQLMRNASKEQCLLTGFALGHSSDAWRKASACSGLHSSVQTIGKSRPAPERGVKLMSKTGRCAPLLSRILTRDKGAVLDRRASCARPAYEGWHRRHLPYHRSQGISYRSGDQDRNCARAAPFLRRPNRFIGGPNSSKPPVLASPTTRSDSVPCRRKIRIPEAVSPHIMAANRQRERARRFQASPDSPILVSESGESPNPTKLSDRKCWQSARSTAQLRGFDNAFARLTHSAMARRMQRSVIRGGNKPADKRGNHRQNQVRALATRLADHVLVQGGHQQKDKRAGTGKTHCNLGNGSILPVWRN